MVRLVELLKLLAFPLFLLALFKPVVLRTWVFHYIIHVLKKNLEKESFEMKMFIKSVLRKPVTGFVFFVLNMTAVGVAIWNVSSRTSLYELLRFLPAIFITLFLCEWQKLYVRGLRNSEDDLWRPSKKAVLYAMLWVSFVPFGIWVMERTSPKDTTKNVIIMLLLIVAVAFVEEKLKL